MSAWAILVGLMACIRVIVGAVLKAGQDNIVIFCRRRRSLLDHSLRFLAENVFSNRRYSR